MSGTFKSSRLVEELKLGASRVTKGGCNRIGGDLPAEFGLPLTFTQDRALTAVQLLLAWQGMRPSGVTALSERMKAFDWMPGVPYVEIDTFTYCRAYTGTTHRRIDDDALRALSELAGRDFYMSIPLFDEPVSRIVRSPVLVLKEKGASGNSYPSHLRIVLSPVVFHGLDDAEPRYVRKPTDLYKRIASARGPGRGKRSPQLPRLVSWITIQRRNQILVGSETLAKQLRSGDVTSGHTKRFVRTVSGYLEVLKAAKIVRSFLAPCQATDGQWKIVRYPPPKL